MKTYAKNICLLPLLALLPECKQAGRRKARRPNRAHGGKLPPPNPVAHHPNRSLRFLKSKDGRNPFFPRSKPKRPWWRKRLLWSSLFRLC
jgi:hypothetical protein